MEVSGKEFSHLWSAAPEKLLRMVFHMCQSSSGGMHDTSARRELLDTSTTPLVYRLDALLPPNQQRQSTEGM